MVGFVGLIEGNALTLWRAYGRRLVPWTVIRGEPPRLLRALTSARELSELAAGVGGWANVGRLGFDPVKPGQPVKVVPRVVAEDDLDGSLR